MLQHNLYINLEGIFQLAKVAHLVRDLTGYGFCGGSGFSVLCFVLRACILSMMSMMCL